MGLHSIDGDIHFGGNGFVRLSIKNKVTIYILTVNYNN